MDEMKLKLSTKIMRNIVAKLIAKFIYARTGYKVDIQLNYLNVSFVDGETTVSTNMEMKMDSKEFGKIIKNFGLDD